MLPLPSHRMSRPIFFSLIAAIALGSNKPSYSAEPIRTAVRAPIGCEGGDPKCQNDISLDAVIKSSERVRNVITACLAERKKHDDAVARVTKEAHDLGLMILQGIELHSTTCRYHASLSSLCDGVVSADRATWVSAELLEGGQE